MTTIWMCLRGKTSRDRLAVGTDDPRPGGSAGLEPDGDRPAGRRLAREIHRAAQLALRLEEVDGDLGIGVEPVDFEATVAHLAVPLSEWPRSPTYSVSDRG